jgi:signal transduction histidine kinase
MRLARKLTFLVLFGVGAVFVLHTAWSIRSHMDLYRADATRDHRMMGRALAKAAAAAGRSGGAAAARALLEAADDHEEDLTLRWHSLAPGEVETAPDGEAVLRALQDGQQVSLIARGADGSHRVQTFTGVRLDGHLAGAVEVSESLAEQRYLTWRVRRQLVTASSMVLVCGILSWIVGSRVVGQPTQRLVAKARRIGAGDFTEPLDLRRSDEFGDLAREMNAMASQLDAALRRAREEGEARVAAVEQLRHADRLTTVGVLASGIAHELGTPLNVVLGRAQMILSGEAQDSAQVERSAEVIVEQTERMTRIVRNLLDFARRGAPERRMTDLGELARQSSSLLKPLAARRGVHVACAASQPVLANVDASHVTQVLANLLVNAIQSTARGGRVVVDARSHEGPPAAARAPVPGAYAELRVSDDGEGIPRQVLPAVFDPFFTTKPVGEGTGLGLSVAYGIVEEHGGWIEVDSEPGRGSTFRVWLPCELA